MIIEDIDNTWATSDTHFGHENISRLCLRPPNVDLIMLDEWTKQVPTDAVLLHLGDVVYRGAYQEWEEIIAALPGRKLLVLGNHDKQKPEYYERCGFEIVKPFIHSWGNQVVSFSHYPLEPHEPRTVRDELRIHGHLHNSGYGWEGDHAGSPARVGHCNVSVELTKYKPVNLGVLLRAYTS
jgi:calcineurin-like phosphoesterase family protein